ncbi:acyltransferase [Candidatus Collierbacteria bacterium]|nr:acyltransferase [Candidatus Collierbacteria bacterium]
MLTEIGLRRLLKYFIFGLWDMVFRLLPWSPLRVLWMKLFGANIPWSAVIDKVNFMNLDRTGLPGLTLGSKVFLGPGSIIDLAGRVEIGDHAAVSPGVIILSHLSVGFSDHPLIKHYPKRVEKTVIGTGVFIGANATVLSGVTIGKETMVGAGTVVTKNIPEKVLAAGVPAEIKKKLTYV